MKLRNLILLFASLTLSMSILAQDKMNVDNLRFNYRERTLPTSPQSPLLFYYAAKIDIPNSMYRYIDPDDLYQGLFIDGQRQTDQPNANDYFVTVSLAPIEIVKNEICERVEETTDDYGNPIRLHFFWVEIDYTFAAIGILTHNNKRIDNNTLAARNTVFHFRSPEYNNPRTASAYWKDNRDVLIEQFTRDCSRAAISKLSQNLSRKYGFVIVSTSALIKTIKEKNHSENDQLRQMSNELKARMESLDGYTPLAEEDMNYLIEYFEDIPERYTTTSKADTRLRYVAYYNLCRIYIYLDQPLKVKKYADLLTANGYDKKDGQRLIKDASKLEEKLNKSFFRRSQFDTDLFYED